MGSKDWPKLLRFFQEELGYQVRVGKRTLGYDLFTGDKQQFDDLTLVLSKREL
jgi:hypothetical protein